MIGIRKGTGLSAKSFGPGDFQVAVYKVGLGFKV